MPLNVVHTSVPSPPGVRHSISSATITVSPRHEAHRRALELRAAKVEGLLGIAPAKVAEAAGRFA